MTRAARGKGGTAWRCLAAMAIALVWFSQGKPAFGRELPPVIKRDGFQAYLPGRTREQQALSKALAHYAMGVIFDNEGKTERAKDAYMKAAESDPASAAPYVRWAADLFLLGKTEESVEMLKGLLERHPSHTHGRFLLAVIYSNMQKFDLAAEEYQRIIKADVADIKALSSLADLLVFQKKFAEAAEVYEKLVTTGEATPLVFFNLGMIYTRLEKVDSAIEQFRSAAQIKPNYLGAHIGLGVLYETKGEYPDAVSAYEDALDYDPTNTLIHKRLAEALIKAHEIEKALEIYHRLIALEPEDKSHYLGYALACFKTERYREAESMLEEALESFGEHFEILLTLGFARQKLNNDEEAVLAYRRAVALEEDNPRARLYLATSLEKLGRKGEAIEHLKKAIELDGGWADALNALAYLYAEEGIHLEEAEILVKKALAREKENGAYLDSLGWIYFKQGRIDEAFEALKEAAAIERDDPIVIEHLAEVCYKKGDLRQSRELYQKLLRLDPEHEKAREGLEKIKANEHQSI